MDKKTGIRISSFNHLFRIPLFILLDRFDSMCYNTYIDIIIYFLLPNFIRMADRKTLQRQVLALWLCVKFEDSREELIFIFSSSHFYGIESKNHFLFIWVLIFALFL